MKFSVITVCLNSVQTIEKTIQSVISQKNVDLDYIIVDGGSKDGTLDIIKKYDQKIARWASEPDQGLYDAMNKGIRLASGEVISFLNSNDWYEQNIFPSIEKLFEQYECDIVAGRQALIRDNRVIGYSSKKREESDLYINMIYSHPAIFAKRRLFLEFGGFDLQYRICADYDWMLRVYKEKIKIECTDLVTTNFTLGGISSGIDCIEEQKEISNKHLPENLKEQYSEKIMEFYQKCIDINHFESELKRIEKEVQRRRKLKYVLRERCHWSECCNLFGTGLRAHQCVDLMEALEMKVGHIYDNSIAKQGTEYRGKIIEKPVFVEDENTWIITSTIYEDEIRQQMEKLGIKNYVAFSDIIKAVSEFASGKE